MSLSKAQLTSIIRDEFSAVWPTYAEYSPSADLEAALDGAGMILGVGQLNRLKGKFPSGLCIVAERSLLVQETNGQLTKVLPHQILSIKTEVFEFDWIKGMSYFFFTVTSTGKISFALCTPTRASAEELVVDLIQMRDSGFDSSNAPSGGITKASERSERMMNGSPKSIAKALLMSGWGLKSVEIFSDCTVRVGSGSVEQLLSIEASMDNLQKKSAAGRAVGFVFTGGLNMLSPNKRGDITLTIVTDSQVHVIHTDRPQENQLKDVLKMEAAGKGVIAQRNASNANPMAPAPKSVGTTIEDSLQKLADLREKGAITDEEFSQAKKKLLE